MVFTPEFGKGEGKNMLGQFAPKAGKRQKEKKGSILAELLNDANDTTSEQLRESPTYKEDILWYWYNDDKKAMPYTQEISKQIEAAFK